MSGRLLKKIRVQEDGQDLVEYILLFTLLVIVAIAGMTAFGARILALFNSAVGTF